MKNNYVAKHMNTFNKASVHKNIRKQALLNDELAIEEGLSESDFDKTDNIKLESVISKGETE